MRKFFSAPYMKNGCPYIDLILLNYVKRYHCKLVLAGNSFKINGNLSFDDIDLLSLHDLSKINDIGKISNMLIDKICSEEYIYNYKYTFHDVWTTSLMIRYLTSDYITYPDKTFISDIFKKVINDLDITTSLHINNSIMNNIHCLYNQLLEQYICNSSFIKKKYLDCYIECIIYWLKKAVEK